MDRYCNFPNSRIIIPPYLFAITSVPSKLRLMASPKVADVIGLIGASFGSLIVGSLVTMGFGARPAVIVFVGIGENIPFRL